MVALAKQKRRIPANVWRAARALYVSDPTMTLERIAERFGVTVAAVRKRCSRERWRERLPEAAGATPGGLTATVAELVPVVTSKESVREFVRHEATELLRLLRRARLTAQHEPLEAARTIAPVLERLSRVLEQGFEHEESERDTGTGTVLCAQVFFGMDALPLDFSNETSKTVRNA